MADDFCVGVARGIEVGLIDVKIQSIAQAIDCDEIRLVWNMTR